MTADKAVALGLTPGRVSSTPASWASTRAMLTGPIDATQRLLARTGMTIDDIDVAEVNEAASVVLASRREVGADLERTNPNGGAIALGHPAVESDRCRARHQGPPRARAGRQVHGAVSMLRRRPGTGTIIERI